MLRVTSSSARGQRAARRFAAAAPRPRGATCSGLASTIEPVAPPAGRARRGAPCARALASPPPRRGFARPPDDLSALLYNISARYRLSDGDCRSSVRGVARAKLRYEYIYIEREHGSRARRILLTYSIPVRLTNTIAFILNSLVCGGATSSFVRWEDADV